MKWTRVLVIGLLAAAVTQADFSYTTTRKSMGGMMGNMANALPGTTKNYFKGQKTRVETGDVAVILDFDAQTITNINNKARTVSVKPFSELGQSIAAGAEMHADVKETGQKKTVNGFSCSQLVLTMDVDVPQARQLGGKMQMEVEMWISPDVPGVDQLRGFYSRNASKFPWAALAGGANFGMQQAMAELQRKMASMNGVPVEQVIRIKAPGMPAATAGQMQQAGQPGMAQAKARLEAMIAQGGPGAEAAKQALARMGGGSPAAGGASNALIEMTMDSSDFSVAAIPDSVFAVPADYTRTAK